jgi:hypothetical protein
MISDEPVVESDGVTCHECGATFTRPGYHWSQGACDYPALPDDKDRLVLGLMLGDGTLRRHTTHPFVQTYMINEPFLEWLDDELEWLSTGVSRYRTAEQGASISRNNGHESADAENYHDVYVMQTRTMPQFETYEPWYADSTRKQFPDDITLSPIDTKIWYACDGSLNWDRRYPDSRPYATIGVASEMDDIETVLDMFRRSTFEYVPRVDENTIRFSVDETESFLEWMGAPPVGFEYKWMVDDLDEYESLKDAALGDD